MKSLHYHLKLLKEFEAWSAINFTKHGLQSFLFHGVTKQNTKPTSVYFHNLYFIYLQRIQNIIFKDFLRRTQYNSDFCFTVHRRPAVSQTTLEMVHLWCSFVHLFASFRPCFKPCFHERKKLSCSSFFETLKTNWILCSSV